MRELIRAIEEILSGPGAEANRVLQVAGRVEQFGKGAPVIDPEYLRRYEGRYSRNLVHRDKEDRFVLVVLVWGPGQGTPIHDHGTWGVVGMLDSKIAAWVYKRDDDGKQDGYAEVRQIQYNEAEAGVMLPVVLPPDDEIHRIQNIWNEPAVSLHVYGKDIVHCRRYDLERKSCEWYELEYTNEGIRD